MAPSREQRHCATLISEYVAPTELRLICDGVSTKMPRLGALSGTSRPFLPSSFCLAMLPPEPEEGGVAADEQIREDDFHGCVGGFRRDMQSIR